MSVRRSKDTLLATVSLAAGVRGDVGYPMATLRKIEMPEPPAIKKARSLLNAGKAAEAVVEIRPVVIAQADLRDIPGNWWAPAALVYVDGLIALKRDRDAEAIINDLATKSQDPELLQSARMALAELWLRNQRTDEAMAIFDATIAASQKDATRARAWRDKGDALFARKDYDGALLAYLRVPVFYPEQAGAMPGALLGSARAFEGLADYEHASAQLAELTKKYAGSPEAIEARIDSLRIEKKRDPDSNESGPSPTPTP
jgi:tetratricopeptide (TPR) repeat protein